MRETYPARLRVMHWLVAVLVIGTWSLGYLIKFIRDDVKLSFYLVHESFGFLILWLMILRIAFRFTSRVPAATAGLTGQMARLVHTLLYVGLVVMPISGFLATNAHGFPLEWFGILPIWSPIGKMPDVAPILSAIHEWTGWILLALFALHLSGVLMHHIIKRDDTLNRML